MKHGLSTVDRLLFPKMEIVGGATSESADTATGAKKCKGL